MSQTTTSFNSTSASWEEHRAAFFKAIENSDIPTLQTVLTKYPEAVEWQNQRGERPLHLAFEKRDRDTFLHLLQQGANPDQQSVIPQSLFYRFWQSIYGANPAEHILKETVKKGEKDYIIPLLQHGAQTMYADTYLAPKDVRYEISDLLQRADKIRKEFLAEQKAAKAPPSLAPAAAKPDAADNGEIEVLKPVKVKNRTSGQTP